ncbi:MAG: hypothetical protein EHM14_09750 [Methanothrix sp.]|nr:MAG: hypothetical protein EHM14_09750 [Methanothrix sp.]
MDPADISSLPLADAMRRTSESGIINSGREYFQISPGESNILQCVGTHLRKNLKWVDKQKGPLVQYLKQYRKIPFGNEDYQEQMNLLMNIFKIFSLIIRCNSEAPIDRDQNKFKTNLTEEINYVMREWDEYICLLKSENKYSKSIMDFDIKEKSLNISKSLVRPHHSRIASLEGNNEQPNIIGPKLSGPLPRINMNMEEVLGTKLGGSIDSIEQNSIIYRYYNNQFNQDYKQFEKIYKYIDPKETMDRCMISGPLILESNETPVCEEEKEPSHSKDKENTDSCSVNVKSYCIETLELIEQISIENYSEIDRFEYYHDLVQKVALLRMNSNFIRALINYPRNKQNDYSFYKAIKDSSGTHIAALIAEHSSCNVSALESIFDCDNVINFVDHFDLYLLQMEELLMNLHEYIESDEIDASAIRESGTFTRQPLAMSPRASAVHFAGKSCMTEESPRTGSIFASPKTKNIVRNESPIPLPDEKRCKNRFYKAKKMCSASCGVICEPFAMPMHKCTSPVLKPDSILDKLPKNIKDFLALNTPIKVMIENYDNSENSTDREQILKEVKKAAKYMPDSAAQDLYRIVEDKLK